MTSSDQAPAAVREQVRQRAQQLAANDDRHAPSLRDVLHAAIDLGSFSARMGRASVTLGALLAPDDGEHTRAATTEQLDEIFSRAAALAVALDQPLGADHVATVTARHQDLSLHGVEVMLRQMLMQAVAGPSEQEQLEMMEDVRNRAAESGSATIARGTLIHTDDSHRHRLEPTGANTISCPSCGQALHIGVNLRHDT